jgi:hypothetical protein
VCSAKQTVFLDAVSGDVKRFDAEGFCAQGAKGPEVVISRRGRVALWNAEKGEESKLLRESLEGGASEFLSLSPDGKFLFRSGFRLAAQILSIQDAALPPLPEDFHEEARDATWSADSKHIAVAGASGRHQEFGGVTILGTDGKIVRERDAKGGAFTAAWAPDGKTVWWSDREALRALNVGTGEEEEIFRGLIAWWRFLDAATALAWDGQKLSLWHVPSRRPMKVFEESAGYRGVEVSPDGRRVAFADATGATVFELSR